jgi:DNA-binding MarR family transcriptional regulator
MANPQRNSSDYFGTFLETLQSQVKATDSPRSDRILQILALIIDQPTTVTAIAKSLNLQQQKVEEMVQRMIAARLVSAKPSADKGETVTITKQGRSLVAAGA